MKKKELVKNLLELKRVASKLGFSLDKIGFIGYYLDYPLTELRPKKVLGIQITGGKVDFDDCKEGK